MYLKGQFTIRWKLLSTHTHMDESLGKFFFLHKTLLVFGWTNEWFQMQLFLRQVKQTLWLRAAFLWFQKHNSWVGCTEFYIICFSIKCCIYFGTPEYFCLVWQHITAISAIFSLWVFPFLWMRTYFHFCDSRYFTDQGHRFLWLFTMQLYLSSFLIFSISLMKDESVNQSLVSITNVLFLK